MNKSTTPKKPKKTTNNKPLKIDDMLEQLYQNRPKDLQTHIASLTDDEEIPEADTINLDQPPTTNDDQLVTNLDQDCELINGNETQIIIHDQPTQDQHRAIIEAALFLAGQNGLKIFEIKRMLVEWVTNSDYLHGLIKKMSDQYQSNPASGFVIEKFDDTYKIVTKPTLKKQLAQIIKIQLKSALTPSLLEVLAIIAYNNPCTKSLIYKVRKIDPTNAIDKLIRLELIYRHKRSDLPGKPWLYKLTNKFFDLFGIKSTSQLPKVSVTLNEDFETQEDSFFESNFFDANRPNESDSSDIMNNFDQENQSYQE